MGQCERALKGDDRVDEPRREEAPDPAGQSRIALRGLADQAAGRLLFGMCQDRPSASNKR